MNFEITETIFSNPQSLLDDWKMVIRTGFPSHCLFLKMFTINQIIILVNTMFLNVPRARLARNGIYALGDWELNNNKYVQGRAAVAQFILPIRLAIFKALRQGLTSGEPDLFLYKDDGSVLLWK